MHKGEDIDCKVLSVMIRHLRRLRSDLSNLKFGSQKSVLL